MDLVKALLVTAYGVKKNFSSFCQPTRLITCDTASSGTRAIALAHMARCQCHAAHHLMHRSAADTASQYHTMCTRGCSAPQICGPAAVADMADKLPGDVPADSMFNKVC